jgi:hypothetical protein
LVAKSTWHKLHFECESTKSLCKLVVRKKNKIIMPIKLNAAIDISEYINEIKYDAVMRSTLLKLCHHNVE